MLWPIGRQPMRSTLKFLAALIAAFVAMLLFRALVFTIYTVPGSQLEPTFKAGDRVMVNRWSYGLRTGDGRLFPYGRLWQRPVRKGHWVVVDDAAGQTLMGRCTALPGDTVCWQERRLIVPSKAACARHDYYLIDGVGFVCEEQIVGRVALVVYNHTPGSPFWCDYPVSRLLLPL